MPPVNDPRGAFNADVYETAELIVPDESLELYMAAEARLGTDGERDTDTDDTDVF